ncbi:MAG: GAF domain-containing protein [Gammaproteobacteria bacterium]|nr:GAF domain-containing protein [Gammaproteobacteria bacterium]
MTQAQDNLAQDNFFNKIEKLNAIGIALSSEKDLKKLMENILVAAKSITNADGGTLYSMTEDKTLKFEIIHTDSLQFSMGGTSDNPIPFADLETHNEENRPNNHLIACCCANNNTIINITDAYDEEDFDFSGTRAFDKKTGYRSKSFLTIPMQNHHQEIIGVLQLINKLDNDGNIINFNKEDQKLAESLTSQAAIALTNNKLIEELKMLFESFIQLIATAIDEKSPYTGKHCRRVPILTMMLAEEADQSDKDYLKDFQLCKKEHYALEIAAWLHDCGKIVTPEYVVDKAQKLETIFDRIELVDARFDNLRQINENKHLKKQIEHLEGKITEDQYQSFKLEQQQQCQQLDSDQAFVRACNTGGEFMSADDQARIQAIGQYTLTDDSNLLTENEIKNLNITKGTLNNQEREIINNHMAMTIKMLEALPFPAHLQNVPEYAGGHHEQMNGKGYPKGLHREQMSIPARVMAIADIFEALTAKDRPYKDGKPLSVALTILGKMKQEGHIDPDLFDLFIENKVYLRYAEEHVDPSQIDISEPSEIPGYPFNMPDQA